MDRWYWTESTFVPGELAKFACPCKKLYDGDNRTNYEDGNLTLTNLRILWKHPSQSKSLGLSLGIVLLMEEESAGFLSSAKLVLQLSPKPPDQPTGPIGFSSTSQIKLAMKQGDLSTFVAQLHVTLADRDWESNNIQNLSLTKSSVSSRNKPVRAGILGIERAMEAKAQATNQSISVAFEDLKQLMIQAKEMVSLSHNIAARIKEQENDASSDETTKFRSCLLSLGIDDPVTRDAVGSTSQYHKKLAQEIATALQGPVKEAGGVMLLSEVFCRINRARGLQLLSPEDVANACSLLSTEHLPLTLHTFHSGVRVLQLTSLDTKTLVRETRELLEQECGGRDGGSDGRWKGLSAGEMAREAGLPLLLAKERLALCERNMAALRDESSEGIYFYPNYLMD